MRLTSAVSVSGTAEGAVVLAAVSEVSLAQNQKLAKVTTEGRAVHGWGYAIPILEHWRQGGESLLLQDQRFFSLGSSASRRPSPNRLMLTTVKVIARPGNTANHQLWRR